MLFRSSAYGDPVVVSDFVNPTQFGPGEDFERYPRDLDADAAIAEEAGADVLYAPAVDEIYPPGFHTTVDPGPLADELCGATRPGHFTGVATVVVRLYGLVQPVRAIFGRKDYQQLVLMQRVARDLALPIAVIGAPTVRVDRALGLVHAGTPPCGWSPRLDASGRPATLRACRCTSTPAAPAGRRSRSSSR